MVDPRHRRRDPGVQLQTLKSSACLLEPAMERDHVLRGVAKPSSQPNHLGVAHAQPGPA